MEMAYFASLFKSLFLTVCLSCCVHHALKLRAVCRTFFLNFTGVYKVEHSPPPGGGGNKIKGFGDGEKNQKLKKKTKEYF